MIWRRSRRVQSLSSVHSWSFCCCCCQSQGVDLRLQMALNTVAGSKCTAARGLAGALPHSAQRVLCCSAPAAQASPPGAKAPRWDLLLLTPSPHVATQRAPTKLMQCHVYRSSGVLGVLTDSQRCPSRFVMLFSPPGTHSPCHAMHCLSCRVLPIISSDIYRQLSAVMHMYHHG